MKKVNEVAVLIQARLSSERCPGKMNRPFAGTTLTDVAIEKVLASTVIPHENFYLAVNEPELVAIGEKHGVNVFKRSDASAIWDGGPDAHLTGMYEWWDKIPFKYVVLINACVPFLTTETIDGFFKHYCESESDGLFAVMEKKNYFWNTDGVMISEWPEDEPTLNTKAVGVTWEAAHCLYASRLDCIEQGIWMGDFQVPGQIELYAVPEKECFDVDYEWEFTAYEKMYQSFQKNK
jgi:CMP-N-acetylneuraminic acid synthetase|tara:strand:- start:1014 stop:1718 length:705 start_codon:yes stop_codon:yes gene_type:complete